jgi:hypothetical protein
MGAEERIWAVHHSHRRTESMMQRRACCRWFHRSYGGATSGVNQRPKNNLRKKDPYTVWRPSAMCPGSRCGRRQMCGGDHQENR